MRSNVRRGTIAATALLMTTGAAVSLAVSAPATATGSLSANASQAKPIVPAPAGQLPGNSAPPKGFATWAEVMKIQDRLDKAADKVTAAHAKGFGGVVVSPETGTLKVYWKGQPSAQGKSVLASARQSVKVSVLPASYDQKTLLAETLRVAHQSGVATVSPKADGSGLDVALTSSVSSRSALQSSVAMTVKGDVAKPTLASRGNDSTPYWGGARWNGCSSGFAVNVGGYARMLSAGHCGNQWASAYDGGGDYMGYIFGDDNAYDRLLLTAYSSGRIYDGGSGVNEFSKPVVGASHSYVGDWICDSGAYSGATCNIQVKATNVTLNVGYYIYQTVMAEQVNHTNAVGNGDSGGPAFSLAWYDYNKVIAKGTNTAIDLNTQVPCTGVPAGNGRACAWRMYYVDVVNSLNAYGASIITG